MAKRRYTIRMDLPVEPFRQIIQDAVLEFGSLEAVARECAIPSRTLYAILKERSKLSFSNADKLVTYLKGAGAWHYEPALIPLYDREV